MGLQKQKLALKNGMQLPLTKEKLYKTHNKSLPIRFSFYKLSESNYGTCQKAPILEYPFANI